MLRATARRRAADYRAARCCAARSCRPRRGGAGRAARARRRPIRRCRSSDVRAGMSCTVASVVLGHRRSSTFDARVDDVLSDRQRPAPRADARDASPARRSTRPGVGAGFSGSPVHLPRRRRRRRGSPARSRRPIGAYGGKTRARDADPGDPRRAGRPAARSRLGRALARAAARRRARSPRRSASAASARELGARAAARRAARRAHASARAAARAPSPRRRPRAAARARLGDRDRLRDRRRQRRRGRHGRLRRRRRRLGVRPSVRGRRAPRPVPPVGLRLRRRRQPARHGRHRDLQARRAARRRSATLRQDGICGVVGRLGAAPPSFPLRVTVRDRDTGRLQVEPQPARRRARRRLPDRLLGAQLARRAGRDRRDPGRRSAARRCARAPTCASASAVAPAQEAARASATATSAAAATPRRWPRARWPRDVALGHRRCSTSTTPSALDDHAASRSACACGAGWRSRRWCSVTGPRVRARAAASLTLRAKLRRPGGARITRTIRCRSRARCRRAARRPAAGTDADVAPTGDGLVDARPVGSVRRHLRRGGARARRRASRELAEAISDLHRYDGVTRALRAARRAGAAAAARAAREGIAQRARRVFRDPAIRVAGRARWSVFVR